MTAGYAIPAWLLAREQASARMIHIGTDAGSGDQVGNWQGWYRAAVPLAEAA
jgi:hypothetical protein